MLRDFNVNSMFYNINESKVEDLTGKGISDMNERMIRTPIDAIETFTQDPCRVLRAIRFSNRFNFSISEEIIQAVNSTVVKEAFEKVAVERKQIELDKTFAGKEPHNAVL
jgi:tRNA nucleotidyltransferase (CCA-adding enzyme)